MRPCTVGPPSIDVLCNWKVAWFAARSNCCNRNSSAANMFAISSSAIRRLLLSQVQQTVACNAMHSTEERMCRWLLMMHDRAEGEILAYTHEFLSHMLGANRKSVTLAAQAMQAAGLISYHRGTIRISRSTRPRKGILRVLRNCEGAVRCIPDAPFDCGSRKYKRTKGGVNSPFSRWRHVTRACPANGSVNFRFWYQRSGSNPPG